MIRSKLRQFMQGRYGNDQLNHALTVGYLLVYLLSVVLGSVLLDIATILLLGVAIFRMLSRDYAARRKENAIFMRKARPVQCWIRTQKCIITDREHRYFKCPACGQQLRVPRGRGTIQVSCRNCGNRFQEKS